MNIRSIVLAGLLVPLLLSGCDEGVQPPQNEGDAVGPRGFMQGTITYSHWPTIDSLIDLRIVAFRVFPPSNVVNEVLQGRAIVHPPLNDTSLVPFFVDSLFYNMSLPEGRYLYVAVAQRFGPSLTTDWRSVGQYDLDSNLVTPSAVDIVKDDTLRGIRIDVDFANPPPQPK